VPNATGASPSAPRCLRSRQWSDASLRILSKSRPVCFAYRRPWSVDAALVKLVTSAKRAGGVTRLLTRTAQSQLDCRRVALQDTISARSTFSMRTPGPQESAAGFGGTARASGSPQHSCGISRRRDVRPVSARPGSIVLVTKRRNHSAKADTLPLARQNTVARRGDSSAKACGFRVGPNGMRKLTAPERRRSRHELRWFMTLN
jgi:hypothetical protein